MTSEKAPDLLPCPFCGGAALVAPDSEHSTAFTLTHRSKGCPIDDLWDWYPDINQAIAAWNTRADLVATKDARIAELEKLLEDAAQAVEWGARRLESKSQTALMEKWASEYRAALSKERDHHPQKGD